MRDDIIKLTGCKPAPFVEIPATAATSVTWLLKLLGYSLLWVPKASAILALRLSLHDFGNLKRRIQPVLDLRFAIKTGAGLQPDHLRGHCFVFRDSARVTRSMDSVIANALGFSKDTAVWAGVKRAARTTRSATRPAFAKNIQRIVRPPPSLIECGGTFSPQSCLRGCFVALPRLFI